MNETMTEVTTETLITVTTEAMIEDTTETGREIFIMVDMIAIAEEEATEGILKAEEKAEEKAEVMVVHHMEAPGEEVPHAEDQFSKGMNQIDLLLNAYLLETCLTVLGRKKVKQLLIVFFL